MTIVELMTDLADFLKEKNKDYLVDGPSGVKVHLLIEAGHLSIRDGRAEQRTPSIEIAVVKNLDDNFDLTSGESIATARIYITTYSEDKKEGWREIYNLVEKNRQLLLRHKTINKRFRLIEPLDINFPNPAEQPFPSWLAYIDAKYAIPQPVEVIEDYEY